MKENQNIVLLIIGRISLKRTTLPSVVKNIKTLTLLINDFFWTWIWFQSDILTWAGFWETSKHLFDQNKHNDLCYWLRLRSKAAHNTVRLIQMKDYRVTNVRKKESSTSVLMTATRNDLAPPVGRDGELQVEKHQWTTDWCWSLSRKINSTLFDGET